MGILIEGSVGSGWGVAWSRKLATTEQSQAVVEALSFTRRSKIRDSLNPKTVLKTSPGIAESERQKKKP